MKKLAIALVVFLIFAQNYAQPCRTIQQIGVISNATDTTEWISFSNVSPSLWNFRPQAGQTSFVPSLSVLNNSVGQVVVATPCVSLVPTTTYELSFTFVGLTPGFMNGLSVYLVGNTPSLTEGANPLGNPNQIVGTFPNLPFGTSELSLLITQEHFSQIGGSPENYRIAFRSLTNSRTIPGGGIALYDIQSYITNIVLSEAQNHNLQVVAMTGPLPSCNLNNQILSFAIRNRGFETLAYNVCFRRSTDGASFGNWFCQEFTTGDIPFNEIAEVRLTNHPQTFTVPTVIEAQIQIAGQPASNTLRTTISPTEIRATPYGQSFDSPMFLQTWSIIPNRASLTDTTWHVPREAGGALSGRAIIVTSGDASYDRLVSGCIQLEAGRRYQVSFTYSALENPNLLRPGTTVFSTDGALATRENLRLSVGRSNVPSNADITLMDLRGFNNTDERTITTYFTPTVSGAHFFGFLAYSDALSAGISISDFSIIEAPAARTMPVFMSFETYDNDEGWQKFSQNAIDNMAVGPAVAPNFIMRGWQRSTTATNVAHGGSTGLRTLSSPTGGGNSAITQSENNNNWLISPPIHMEADVPVEIRYFRRAMVNDAVEILNIRVSEFLCIQTLYDTTYDGILLLRDTVRSNVFSDTTVYFTPTRTGVHFVSFQYSSQNRRDGNHGMSLEEISIQDSVRAQEINLSVVELRVPAPACQLPNAAAAGDITLMIKNRTGRTIPANSLGAFFRLINAEAGIDITVRGNRITGGGLGSGNFPEIGPYQTASFSRRHDLRNIGTWEVQAWFESGHWSDTPNANAPGVWNPASTSIDQDPSDDISEIVRTASTGTLRGRYDMGFEPHENVHFWANSQTGRQSRLWWQFTTNPAMAHTGVGSAFIAPSETSIVTGENSQHITSPCLDLSADTTYFVSFHYRAVRDYNNLLPLSPVRLYTLIGTDAGLVTDNRRDTAFAESLTYRQRSFYFRPNVTGTHYVIFQALSSRWSTGIVIDNFVILDSVSAHTPNLSLNRAWIASANTCDYRSEDTLYVELTNSGLSQIENPRFRIEFGNQTHNDTWQGVIPPGATEIIRLNQRVTHTAFGTTHVVVALTLDVNLSGQTTYATRSIKTAPIRPPFTINFQTAGNADRLAWNNLPLSFNQQVIQPTFEYWTINNAGASFHPNHQHLLPGILASPCFILETGEPHVIIYEYRRGANAATPENLRLQIEKADGTIEDIYIHTSNQPTGFVTNTVDFELPGQTEEQMRVRFFSDHNFFATGIYIRSFSIVPESYLSTADFHTATGNRLSIHPNPATTEVFIQSEQEISTLFIHDIRGQLIREIRVNNTEYHLNTTDFPAGIYVFTIVVGNERVSKRIIIND